MALERSVSLRPRSMRDVGSDHGQRAAFIASVDGGTMPLSLR
jgi:hypothetical protein